MKPKVLVCAHSDAQFRVLTHNTPFFAAARQHEVLKRIYEIGDLTGFASSVYLFVLPGWEMGTRRHEEVLAYWKFCRNPVVELTDEQVTGKVPFVPPADAPWSNLYRPKQYIDGATPNTFPEFPKYFGRAKRVCHGELHA